MLAIEVNHKWDACPSKGSTQAPVHPHIKLSKYRTRIIWAWWKLAWRYSHVSSERFSYYKSLSRLVLCYKKDWATLLHFIYFCYLLLVTTYLITKLSVTTYFSTCREYLAENRIISFCSSLGSTLLLIERTMIDPLYFWVIKTLFWRRCRGV